MPNTFKKVTNNEMYNKIMNVHDDVIIIKQQVKHTNGTVRFHNKWLWGLTGASASGFVCLVGFIIKYLGG